jgi:ABC-type protease/lipase transport system fused ATPase/permease subunit
LAKKIGLLGSVKITKKSDKIKIEKEKNQLIYTYSKNNRNFDVIPFLKMNEKYLKNWKTIQEKYLKIADGK